MCCEVLLRLCWITELKTGTKEQVFEIKLLVQCYPGRTFLGKRRYFSGIVALTPLTPLTYKQNAVNAFIPTSKTPLTPLYRQKNAINAAIFPVNNGFCG